MHTSQLPSSKVKHISYPDDNSMETQSNIITFPPWRRYGLLGLTTPSGGWGGGGREDRSRLLLCNGMLRHCHLGKQSRCFSDSSISRRHFPNGEEWSQPERKVARLSESPFRAGSIPWCWDRGDAPVRCPQPSYIQVGIGALTHNN